MEHKKRGLALLLALTLTLLCGCEGMVSERPMEDLSGWTIETGADVPTQDAFAAETQMATLYLLSADGDRLVPVPAEVTMRDGESLAQAALTALLDGAKLGRTDATWPMNGEGKAPTLSVSDGIATVNLPARYRALEPKTLFAVRQAVANTLGSLSGIAYVNVLIGGREEGLDLGATTPVGTLTRIDDLDVQGRYNRLDDQRLSGAGYTRLTTLFFPSADGKMLLPVVRTLAYDAGAAAIDCLYTVLEALGSVSADELIEQHVPEPMGYISEMPEIVRMPETGEQAIEIRFSGELTQALEEQKLTLGVYLGMLTRTLMGVVPGVDGVHVLIDGAAVTALDAEKTPDGEALAFKNELMQGDDFLSWIGAPVIVYDGAEQSGKLIRARCLMRESEQNQTRARLETLIARWNEDAVSAADILAVSTEVKNVVVNLSGGFAAWLQTLDGDAAREKVYSMVNTMTQGRSQQSVIFFFVIDQFGVILRAHARQRFAFRLRNAQPLKRVFDILRHVAPLGLHPRIRADIGDDVIHIQPFDGRTPVRHAHVLIDLQRLQAEKLHPRGIVLFSGNLLDDGRSQARAELECVFLIVFEIVDAAVNILDIGFFFVHGCSPFLNAARTRQSRSR